MERPLRALIVEDHEPDAVLVVRELRRGRYDVTYERVETAEQMGAALDRQAWDIVLCDYSMPRFDAPSAFSLMRDKGLDLPFIIVSGTVGEERAVEAMRTGVHDYLLKDKLARLVPAVERELREATLRAERRQMQEQLLLSDRMASVGTLAAGVAHEINNPLAVLIANLDFAMQDLARLGQDARTRSQDAQSGGEACWEWLSTRLGEVQEPLQSARESAERVRQIVLDIKIFSRPDAEKQGPVDVRRVLESSLRMAWNEIKHRARVVKDICDVPPVEGNEARIGQVFLNLIVNAAQAIPEGRSEDNEIRVGARLADDGRVLVEVGDTGCGIPEEIRARIFDSFFTTKPVGVGMGLGLAICHRIVTSLGGEILVESHVGKGTTFRALFPVARAQSATPEPVTAVSVAARRGRILVIDDEVALGKVVRRMLTPDHEVITLTTATEAFERIASGERFDLILCDLMMPHMSGMDLHAELTRVAADQAQRMVFMTGGAFTPLAREFLDHVANARIEKPFEAQSLRQLVASVLR
jgi:signal transduction histidine kinase